MGNCMKYKDYYGTIEYSDEDQCFHGKVLGINGLVTFEGESVQELRASFQEMVDEYLKDCESKHIAPDKRYKGSFNIRIAPELHREASLRAKRRDFPECISREGNFIICQHVVS